VGRNKQKVARGLRKDAVNVYEYFAATPTSATNNFVSFLPSAGSR
jgi:hypothetical protein